MKKKKKIKMIAKQENGSLLQLMLLSHLSLSNSTGAGKPLQTVAKCVGIMNWPLQTFSSFKGHWKHLHKLFETRNNNAQDSRTVIVGFLIKLHGRDI